MVANIIFYTGLTMSVFTGGVAWIRSVNEVKEDLNRTIVVFPFMLLLAAVIAKYLGL